MIDDVECLLISCLRVLSFINDQSCHYLLGNCHPRRESATTEIVVGRDTVAISAKFSAVCGIVSLNSVQGIGAIGNPSFQKDKVRRGRKFSAQ